MHVAIIRNHDYPNMVRAIKVPDGQSLGFDEDGATRKWLWPYLGTEWHLIEIVEVEA